MKLKENSLFYVKSLGNLGKIFYMKSHVFLILCDLLKSEDDRNGESDCVVIPVTLELKLFKFFGENRSGCWGAWTKELRLGIENHGAFTRHFSD